MKETFKILSRLSKHKAHAETEVTIDWEGTTPEQMQILARGFLVYCAQAAWAKEGKAPEEYRVLAKLQAHPYVPLVCTYIPRPPKSKLSVDFDALLGNCSENERAEILRMLEEIDS